MLKYPCGVASLLVTTSLLPTLWAQTPPATTTPIKYIVVIFQENNSFDHYFGTYPNALCPAGTASTPAICSESPAGESPFTPLPNTPSINGLTPVLNNISAVAPFRLDRSQAVTCDNSNAYTAEQNAYNSGAVNLFPANASLTKGPPTPCITDLLMGYYDGNTVTALWNYAQYFAMSDNYFDTEFGVTEEGHQNLIAGQTHTTSVTTISGKIVNGSIIANVEAGVDDCVTSANGTPVLMTSKNIGDLLTAQNITWGWFYADYPQATANAPVVCASTYNSHYDPFMYYQSTSNPHHLPASSVS